MKRRDRVEPKQGVETSVSRSQSGGYVIIAVIYLLGLFIGAIDTGILTPSRVIIQNQFGVSDQLGVWIITVYTLAYAVSIPIMGKMADRVGRKYIYLLSILLFGVGSLCCGLARFCDNFYLLLLFRAVQAFGGGGIMPVATAELGTAFPPEKRGLALGLVGGVYGIANVFGASLGSMILNIFGQSEWQFIFFVNLPICLVVLIIGFLKLKNSKADEVKPVDGWGIAVLTLMILCLMYGLKNIDFFNLTGSIASTDVYPFLLGFVVLLPLFVLVEHRAADPVMNLSLFRDFNIVITLILSVISGVILMGMVFIPQFAENCLGLASGQGGYFVIVLGLFAGLGAPLSGKLIDRSGPKIVLAIGFGASLIGGLYLSLVACTWPTLPNLIVSLILCGVGIGFTMGTPLNYMMLERTDPNEANSSLATLSLVRSIGTVIGPAIMVAFLAQAGLSVQDRITDVLPNEVTVSQLPYAQELTDTFDKLKSDKNAGKSLKDVKIPDLLAMSTVKINTDSKSGKYTVSDSLKQMMEDSDYSTIVDNTKTFSSSMFAQVEPDLLKKIYKGIDSGIDGMKSAKKTLVKKKSQLAEAQSELTKGIEGIETGIAQQKAALKRLEAAVPMLKKLENYSSVLDLMPASVRKSLPASVRTQLSKVKTAEDLKAVLAQMDTTIAQMQAVVDSGHATPQMETALANMKSQRTMLADQLPTLEKMDDYSSVLDLMPASVEKALPTSVRKQLQDVKTLSDLNAKIVALKTAITKTETSRDKMLATREKMGKGIAAMQSALDQITTSLKQMEVMRAAVPAAFAEAEQKYLEEIDARSASIRGVFQSTLNEGFRGQFIVVSVCSGAGLLFLMLYRSRKREEDLPVLAPTASA